MKGTTVSSKDTLTFVQGSDISVVCMTIKTEMLFKCVFCTADKY